MLRDHPVRSCWPMPLWFARVSLTRRAVFDADIVRASQLPHTVEEINCHIDFSHPTFVYT